MLFLKKTYKRKQQEEREVFLHERLDGKIESFLPDLSHGFALDHGADRNPAVTLEWADGGRATAGPPTHAPG